MLCLCKAKQGLCLGQLSYTPLEAYRSLTYIDTPTTR
jgi:hypothetical protein